MNNQNKDYVHSDWMTPDEAATFWRVSKSTIYAWIRENRIPFRQFGGKGGAIRIPFHTFDPAYRFPLDDPRRGTRETRLPGKIPDWMRSF